MDVVVIRETVPSIVPDPNHVADPEGPGGVVGREDVGHHRTGSHAERQGDSAERGAEKHEGQGRNEPGALKTRLLRADDQADGQNAAPRQPGERLRPLALGVGGRSQDPVLDEPSGHDPGEEHRERQHEPGQELGHRRQQAIGNRERERLDRRRREQQQHDPVDDPPDDARRRSQQSAEPDGVRGPHPRLETGQRAAQEAHRDQPGKAGQRPSRQQQGGWGDQRPPTFGGSAGKRLHQPRQIRRVHHRPAGPE